MHGSPMKKLLSSLQATSTIHFCRIERFTVILYDKPVSPLSLVNEICSVRRIVPWIGFYQQKMLYLSTFSIQFSRLEYGQHALKQNQ